VTRGCRRHSEVAVIGREPFSIITKQVPRFSCIPEFRAFLTVGYDSINHSDNYANESKITCPPHSGLMNLLSVTIANLSFGQQDFEKNNITIPCSLSSKSLLMLPHDIGGYICASSNYVSKHKATNHAVQVHHSPTFCCVISIPTL